LLKFRQPGGRVIASNPVTLEGDFVINGLEFFSNGRTFPPYVSLNTDFSPTNYQSDAIDFFVFMNTG
jgi:hypothetical protein